MYYDQKDAMTHVDMLNLLELFERLSGIGGFNEESGMLFELPDARLAGWGGIFIDARRGSFFFSILPSLGFLSSYF